MKKPLHIAFVSLRFSEQGTVGGAETLLKNLAVHAAEAGHKVTLLTTCAQSHFTWENTLPPGVRPFGPIDVHYFPVDQGRNIDAFLRVQDSISHYGRFTRQDEEFWIKNSVNSQALYDHLRTRVADYDRIIVGPYLFGLTWFAAQIHPDKTFLVPCLHDEPYAYLDIMKDLFAAVAGFLFNSEPETDLARRLFRVPPEKSSVVGMGLDAFDADPKAFATRHKLRTPYVLYSGRRETLKGTPLMCDYMLAFRERNPQHNVKLVFTGSGPIEAPHALEPHILDVGFVSEQEKHEAMAGATAFIHPSVNESFGIVLLESFLAKTPALVHAKSEVLKWQCRRSNGGLWFRNFGEFEQELLLLLEKPDVRQAMGNAGRDYVLREYPWPVILQKMEAALER